MYLQDAMRRAETVERSPPDSTMAIEFGGNEMLPRSLLRCNEQIDKGFTCIREEMWLSILCIT